MRLCVRARAREGEKDTAVTCEKISCMPFPVGEMKKDTHTCTKSKRPVIYSIVPAEGLGLSQAAHYEEILI